MFTLDGHDEDRDNFPWKGEPILRNGQYVGNVTCSTYGYTLKQIVCLGFISNGSDSDQPITVDYISDKDAHYEIVIGDRRYPAHASAYPPKIEATNLGFYLPRSVSI